MLKMTAESREQRRLEAKEYSQGLTAAESARLKRLKRGARDRRHRLWAARDRAEERHARRQRRWEHTKDRLDDKKSALGDNPSRLQVEDLKAWAHEQFQAERSEEAAIRGYLETQLAEGEITTAELAELMEIRAREQWRLAFEAWLKCLRCTCEDCEGGKCTCTPIGSPPPEPPPSSSKGKVAGGGDTSKSDAVVPTDAVAVEKDGVPEPQKDVSGGLGGRTPKQPEGQAKGVGVLRSLAAQMSGEGGQESGHPTAPKPRPVVTGESPEIEGPPKRQPVVAGGSEDEGTESPDGTTVVGESAPPTRRAPELNLSLTESGATLPPKPEPTVPGLQPSEPTVVPSKLPATVTGPCAPSIAAKAELERRVKEISAALDEAYFDANDAATALVGRGRKIAKAKATSLVRSIGPSSYFIGGESQLVDSFDADKFLELVDKFVADANALMQSAMDAAMGAALDKLLDALRALCPDQYDDIVGVLADLGTDVAALSKAVTQEARMILEKAGIPPAIISLIINLIEIAQILNLLRHLARQLKSLRRRRPSVHPEATGGAVPDKVPPPRRREGDSDRKRSGGGAGRLGIGDAAGVRAELSQLPKPKHYPVVRSEAELNDLFGRLSQGGRPAPHPTYRGPRVELPDGTKIGWRASSKSGGATIDIKYPDGTATKVHVQP
jgi:hypothetical protein